MVHNFHLSETSTKSQLGFSQHRTWQFVKFFPNLYTARISPPFILTLLYINPLPEQYEAAKTKYVHKFSKKDISTSISVCDVRYLL